MTEKSLKIPNLTEDQQKILVLMKINKNPNSTIEELIEADIAAMKIFLEMGHSVKEAKKIFNETFLHFDADRYMALNKFIDDYSKMETKTDDFFTQRLKVVDLYETHSWEFCKQLCVDKKVLHIGCSDWPIFNPKCNMHIFLSEFCKELHGLDPNGIKELREHFDGTYFQTIHKADLHYDVVLVPNIIEHLVNPGEMVKDLFKLNFKKMFVLVPNAKVYEQATYENGLFKERIHPDHYAWYSPYTLYNLFRKQIHEGDYDYDMNFFDNQNMISILITKK